MKLRLVMAVIAIAFMSSCAPQVLCPAYAVDDQPVEKEVKAETKENS